MQVAVVIVKEGGASNVRKVNLMEGHILHVSTLCMESTGLITFNVLKKTKQQSTQALSLIHI